MLSSRVIEPLIRFEKPPGKRYGLKAEEINLDKFSQILYFPKFLSLPVAENLFQKLKKDIPWTHGYYQGIPTPRLLYAFRDQDDDIRSLYSKTGSLEWFPEVKEIKERIEGMIQKKIRYAQLNYYRTGQDWIGFHSDMETKENSEVISLSLGSERKFVFRRSLHLQDNVPKYSMVLKPGSLIRMNTAAVKTRWQHSLPKTRKPSERINITFRL